jgi:hypothetical protein
MISGVVAGVIGVTLLVAPRVRSNGGAKRPTVRA